MQGHKNANRGLDSNTSQPEFANLPIHVDELPKTEDLVFEALAPSYIRTLIIETTLRWVVITSMFLVLAYFRDNVAWLLGQWQFFAPMGILVAASFVWQVYLARSRGFVLREKDIHYKSGVIWQKVVSLPYNRVQHVAMESNPLERRFKLTTLKFFTSGGGKADMKIPALEFERASRLRAFVVERAAIDMTSKESSDDSP